MSDVVKQKVDTRIVVETPEGVDFRFVIAGPGKRMASYLIDWAIKATAITLVVILIIFLGIFGEAGIGLGGGVFFASLFLVDWFYNSLFETLWNGQTPGKKSRHLRVVRSNGTPITASSAIGRNFLSAADCQPALFFPLYTVGMLTMLCNRRMQRLGDLIFDTMVIDESREFISRAAGVTFGIESIPRAECRGRYSVPERTLAVIERLFEGDRIISDGRREEIAKPLSLMLRQRLGWEEPGPDPHNPHLYFQQGPNRHTLFLRRLLKTFADDPGDDDEAKQKAKRAARETSGGSLRRRRKPAAADSLEDDRGIRLEDWLEQESARTTDSSRSSSP